MVKIVMLPALVSRCNIMYCRTQVAGLETGEIRELGHLATNGLVAPKSVIVGRPEPLLNQLYHIRDLIVPQS